MPTHANQTRSYIPVVTDLEALEHARSCVLLRQNQIEAHPSIGGPDPMDSRSLSELDRLIDHARRSVQP